MLAQTHYYILAMKKYTSKIIICIAHLFIWWLVKRSPKENCALYQQNNVGTNYFDLTFTMLVRFLLTTFWDTKALPITAYLLGKYNHLFQYAMVY